MRLVPGLVWAGSIAGVAGLASLVVPLLGAPVLAIVLGVAVSSAREPGEAARPGVAFASTMFLQLAIVLLGATLRLGEIVHVGVRSLPVLLGTLAVALAGAFALGRALAVPPRLRTLVGVGTGICGASAIVAVAAVVEATAAETAFAISTVFVSFGLRWISNRCDSPMRSNAGGASRSVQPLLRLWRT